MKITILINFLLATLLTANDFVIIVVDKSNGKPIENAYILFQDNIIGRTDGKGYFLYKNNQNKISITIMKENYEKGTFHCNAGISTLFLNSFKQKRIYEYVTSRVKPSLSNNKPLKSYVLDKDDIKKIQSTDAGIILENFPGINFQSYYAEGSVSTIHINNSKSRQALVLLNDIPVNDPVFGGFDISLLDLSSFDKIELTCGGLSEWYGQSASAGVLNIIPSEKKEKTVSIAMTVGSYGYLHPRINVSQFITDKWFFSLKPYYRSSKNDYDYEDFFGETRRMNNNYLRNQGLIAENILYPDALDELEILYGYSHLKRGNPGTYSNANPTSYMEDWWHFGNARLITRESKGNILKSTIYFQNKKFMYSNHDGYLIDITRILNITGCNIQNKFRLSPFFSINSGIDGSNTWINAKDIDKETVYSGAIFSGIAYDKRSFLMDFYCRLDKQESMKPVVAPSLSFGLENKHMKNNLKISRSFAYPNLSDLYWPSDNMSEGNKDLQPEYAWNFIQNNEFSMFQNRIDLGISPYFNAAKNEIRWLPDGKSGKWKPVNLSETYNYGVNINLNMDIIKDWLSFENISNLCKTIIDDEESISYSIYTPEIVSSAGFRIGKKVLFLSPKIRYKSKVFANPYSGKTLPDKILYDSEFFLDARKISFGFGIYNIFDKKQWDYEDYPSPGREWRVTISSDLNKELKFPF
ncbi:MAG: TonB-dependent receptor plug domain-containing protein [Candidatus Coatesbacteria bacterium]|nr:TonB-dependent receptor plug domain-containing protein [Candidatus Coatesbacteria bacterium]